MQMQKTGSTAKDGLHRYQAQEHEAVIRSLELESRYCLEGIELLQRRYRRALGRLSVARQSASPPPVADRPNLTHNAISPPQKEINNSEKTKSVRNPHTASTGKTETMRLDRCSPEGTVNGDFDENQMASMAMLLRWGDRKVSWATLSFADIRHRNVAMIKTQEPFRKWQRLLLAPSVQQQY